MSKLLSLLFCKERHCANCSLYKICSDVRKSLSMLFKREQYKWFALDSSKLLANNEQFAIKNLFPPFLCPRANCCCRSLLFFKELLAYVAIYTRATVSESLKVLFKKDQIVRFLLSESLFRSQKTSDSLEKPKSEVPTLI